MVLIPAEFRISRTLAKLMRSSAYAVRTDTAFEQVMRACAAPRTACPEPGRREHHGGTWIGEDMIAAYCALHRLGYAHSVEGWMEDRLVGGLYGGSIGHMFYGESMFSRVSNASKIALAHLARQLERWQFGPSTGPLRQAQDRLRTGMIDCQMNTPHLASLGAREIPRSEFIARLQELVHYAPIADWQFDADLFA